MLRAFKTLTMFSVILPLHLPLVPGVDLTRALPMLAGAPSLSHSFASL